jgi:hypothetical protein
MNELESKFHAFMRSLDDAECIDNIDLPAMHRDERRADYFLDARSTIIELKSLERDPHEKIDKVLDPIRDRDDFPQFFGEAELSKVLGKLTDGDLLKGQILNRITRSIEDAFRSAKKQIASTRLVFECPDAAGILVLLNEDIEILSPAVVGEKCHSLLESATELNQRISLIWFIQNTHCNLHTHGSTVIPSFLISSDKFPLSTRDRGRIERLAEKRAQFEGVPFISNEPASVLERMVTASTIANANATEKKRSDWWRDEYRESPYLRALSDEALIEHTSRVVRSYLPFFVAKSPNALPERSVQNELGALSEIMRGFTHCQMELTDRMIDLRRLGPIISAVHDEWMST